MKAIYETKKKYKSLDGFIYESAKDAREADKDHKLEQLKKVCKHPRTKIFMDSYSICNGYEDYDRGTFINKECLVCQTDNLDVNDKEKAQFHRRQEYNAERREYARLKKRFGK